MSEPYARVIDRALEFKREDRYESAAAMREDVRRAMAEMDGVARTELAIPPPASVPPRSAPPPPRSAPPPPRSAAPPPLPPREPTMEVSERELEPSLPVLHTQQRRRRRSILPWLALLLFVAIGVALWLDSRQEAAAPYVDAGPSASATVSAGPSAAVVPPSSAPAPTARPTPSPTPTPTLAATPAPTPRPIVSVKPQPKPAPKHSGKTGH